LYDVSLNLSQIESHPIFVSYQGISYAPNAGNVRNAAPKDFRAAAIFSAIICFFPSGLFAIYYSFRVSNDSSVEYLYVEVIRWCIDTMSPGQILVNWINNIENFTLKRMSPLLVMGCRIESSA
jgi:hypothetical protein